jgi:hypothetical protein
MKMKIILYLFFFMAFGWQSGAHAQDKLTWREMRMVKQSLRSLPDRIRNAAYKLKLLIIKKQSLLMRGCLSIVRRHLSVKKIGKPLKAVFY